MFFFIKERLHFVQHSLALCGLC